VLLAEFLEVLQPGGGMLIVDCTVGGGGHAEAVLEMVEGRAKLIGIDRDWEALGAASERLARFGDAVTLLHGKFSELDSLLNGAGVDKADRIYFDLGVSSHQLDKAERGFSFLKDGPLDMRMDQRDGETAADLINRLSEKELEGIFRVFGEERYARRVAKELVRMRERGRNVGRTRELAEFLEAVIGRGQRVHPATRIFQALRIAVNDELEELLKGLGSSLKRLSRGGRMAVTSYHSLEDRLVKNFIRDHARAGLLKILTKKPIRPGAGEISQNPRSRSARLRAAERI
jgi:16S rRNA (cytosine1402-N4)-methyltransferase